MDTWTSSLDRAVAPRLSDSLPPDSSSQRGSSAGRARVYNIALHNVPYVQHVQAPGDRTSSTMPRGSRPFATRAEMQVANAAAAVAETRHAATFAEQREVWQSEATHACQAEAQASARERSHLELLAER